MRREEFESLVRKLEGAAAKDPVKYRVKTGLLAALGYGFVLILLVAILGMIALTSVYIATSKRVDGNVIKILLALVLWAFVFLRSLWVKFEKPVGIPLKRENVLPLFQTVDRLTDALGAPRFHHILLTRDFNAAVVQHPRLGILGWQENYLLIGLPLLQGLSPEQFEGVLAHELGHLRGGHGQFGGWIYRVNATWARLLEQFGRQAGLLKVSSTPLHSFFKWYAPYFHAYSFALRRQDEYEADAAAAQLVGGGKYADALCLLLAHGGFMEKQYWKRIYEKHRLQPAPSDTPYMGLIHAFRTQNNEIQGGETTGLIREPIPREEAQKELEEALLEETGFADTHPSLRDRLNALGEEPRLPEPFAESAAGRFLGPSLPHFAARMDAEWRESVTPIWRERHKTAQKEQSRLLFLKGKAVTIPLPTEEAWEQAKLTEAYEEKETALPLYQRLLQREDAVSLRSAAAFAAGRILLEKKDPAGIAFVEQAMAADSQATVPSLKLLYRYYKQTGEEVTAKEIYTRTLNQADTEDEAKQERQAPTGARYLPHGLPAKQLEVVRAQLAELPDAGEAYLVRKELRHFPEKPLYVLGVTLSSPWTRMQTSKDVGKLKQDLLKKISTLPGQGFVIVLYSDNAGIKKRMRKVEGALIYRKPR